MRGGFVCPSVTLSICTQTEYPPWTDKTPKTVVFRRLRQRPLTSTPSAEWSIGRAEFWWFDYETGEKKVDPLQLEVGPRERERETEKKFERRKPLSEESDKLQRQGRGGESRAIEPVAFDGVFFYSHGRCGRCHGCSRRRLVRTRQTHNAHAYCTNSKQHTRVRTYTPIRTIIRAHLPSSSAVTTRHDLGNG